MNKSEIIFDEESERYELDGRSLTCGDTVSLHFDDKWHSARIEADFSKYEFGYYAIIFPNNGNPYSFDLDSARWGSREKYLFDSEEVQDMLRNI